MASMSRRCWTILLRTTISLAIFFSSVIGLTGLGCGKRGDPLPPIRPFPGRAEEVTVWQSGSRIQLSWLAPTRNTDDTTVKLELLEVEIRGRIIDIPSLLEQQTELYEPEVSENQEEEAIDLGLFEADNSVADDTVSTTDLGGDNVEIETYSMGIDGVIDEIIDLVEYYEPWRLPEAPELEIPNFAPVSRPVATLQSVVPGELKAFSIDIDPEWIGQRLQYAVVYINRSGRRGERSVAVQIEPLSALSAPKQPVVEKGDGFVELSWSVDSDSVEEKPYFSVFRRLQSVKDYSLQPINLVPTNLARWRDATVPFDVEVCYSVKKISAPPLSVSGLEGVIKDIDEVVDEILEFAEEYDSEIPEFIVPKVPELRNTASIESDRSPELCLTLIDTFPPPPPLGVAAIASEGRVLLTWNDVERDDIKGFRVYRGTSAKGPFRLLNEELISRPSYSDENVTPGDIYYYAISAVDDAKGSNESERSTPYEVRIQEP